MKNNKSYKLFRTIITNEWRKRMPFIKEETHLISIQMIINNDTWSSNPIPIQPFELRDKIILMKQVIINEITK